MKAKGKRMAGPVLDWPTKMTMQELRKGLAEVSGQVKYGKAPIVVTDYNKEAFAIIPVEHLAILNKALEQQRDAEEAQEAQIRLEDGSQAKPYVPLKLRRQPKGSL